MAEPIVKIRMAGADVVQRNILRATREHKNALAAALYSRALEVIGDSVQMTPVDTGRLRASHYAAPPVGIDDPSVEIGYGTDYAVPVHERMDVHHPVGEAKFLEKAVNRVRPQWLRLLATRQRVFLATGVGVVALAAAAPAQPRKTTRLRQAVGKGVSRSRGLKGAATRRRRRRGR